MIFCINKLCAFVSSWGRRLAKPNEDGPPPGRRLEQTQPEGIQSFEGWFSLESCIGPILYKAQMKGPRTSIEVEI